MQFQGPKTVILQWTNAPLHIYGIVSDGSILALKSPRTRGESPASLQLFISGSTSLLKFSQSPSSAVSCGAYPRITRKLVSPVDKRTATIVFS